MAGASSLLTESFWSGKQLQNADQIQVHVRQLTINEDTNGKESNTLCS